MKPDRPDSDRGGHPDRSHRSRAAPSPALASGRSWPARRRQPGRSLVVRAGRIAGMPIRTIRRILAGVDAELVLTVRWRGGDLDRILDAAHARLGERVVGMLQGDGWVAIPEVSFSVFGDRGSIDILGWHPATRSLARHRAQDRRSRSIEETLRRHDVKLRLARQDRARTIRMGSRSSVVETAGPARARGRSARQVEDKATALPERLSSPERRAVRRLAALARRPAVRHVVRVAYDSARGVPGQPVRTAGRGSRGARIGSRRASASDRRHSRRRRATRRCLTRRSRMRGRSAHA